MPILFGDALDEVVEAMRAQDNEPRKDKARRRLNADYQALAKKESWLGLRKKTTLTYAGSELQLPSNLIGIDMVWDDTNKLEFMGRTRHDAKAGEYAYRYYTRPIGSALATVDDVDISQDQTTFVSDELLALGLTTDDEWFYVNGEDQLYQITSNSDNIYTFSPAYRGRGTHSSATIVVRPPDTLMLDLVAPEGHTLPTGSFEVYYWTMPDYLRDAQDIIHLATLDCLVLRSLSRLPEAKAHRPVTKTMADDALSEALSLNPTPPEPRLARGLNGLPVSMGAELYRARGYEKIQSTGIRNIWQANRA